MLNIVQIQGMFSGCTVGNSVIHLDRTDSTNAQAKSQIRNGAPEGTVIVAEEQTAGKGRMGRSWSGDRGKNLTFSVILAPPVPIGNIGIISLMAAVAVADALETIGINGETKWPNDILLKDRKVCGILSEVVMSDHAAPFVVVGIGLNVNQMRFPADIAERAISLSLFKQKPFDRTDLFAVILTALNTWYEVLRRQEFGKILVRWKQLSTMLGSEISLSEDGTVIHAIALDIADDGALIIHTGSAVKKVYAGDVTIFNRKM